MNLSNQHLIRYKDKEIFFHLLFRSSISMRDNMYDAPCFIYTVNAEGVVSSATARLPLQCEEGALMRCGSYINQWNQIKQDVPVEIIVIKFPADVVYQIFSELNFKPKQATQKAQQTMKAKQDVLLKKYMESLLFYFNNPEVVNDDLVYLKLKELILLLLQLPEQEAVKTTLLHLFDTERFNVLQVVENHLFDNFTVEQLAHFANMSKATFQRRFKECSELSVQKYILSKRLEKAIQLLQDQSKSIADICYDCGFSEPNYFSKVFKQKFGKTPRAYRIAS